MKKKHVVLWSILGAIVILIAAVAIVISSYAADYSKKVAAVAISNVDLSMVPDGTFNGAFDLFPVSVVVDVTVKNNAITTIKLVKHTNGRGAAAEALPNIVMSTQSLDVDTISGATASSKAILKAIENALEGAMN
jgi:uncharacterized protein with FMN-binding domain